MADNSNSKNRGFRLKNIKMKPKMIGLFLLVGLVPLILLGRIASSAAENALMRKSFEKLEAITTLKKASIESYFEQIGQQIRLFSEDLTIVEAMEQFAESADAYVSESGAAGENIGAMKAALKGYYTDQFAARFAEKNDGEKPSITALFDSLDDTTIALQYAYIADNPNPLGEKNLMDRGKGDHAYHERHEQVQGFLRDYLNAFGYYDIFLVDLKGRIVYSQYKELDFATSLIDGPYADSGIGNAYRKARDASDPNFVHLEDYARYLPSYQDPASFVASPIFNHNKEKTGVAIFQMPLARINRIVTERAGMGESGESYLVGPDHLMRSDSYLDPEFHSVVASFANPETGEVRTEAAAAALAGASGTEIVEDYNGNPVLSAYAPVSLLGLDWALLSEIDLAEVRAPVVALLRTILIVSAAIAVVVVLVAYLVASMVAKPIVKGMAFAQLVADGNLTQQADIDQGDEIGMLADALNDMASNLRNIVRDIVQRATNVNASSTRMAATSGEMSSEMTEVSHQAASAASAAEEANSNIKNVAAAIEEISSNANSVAAGSEEVSTNLYAVGSAVEQMSANMNGIASAVEESSTAVGTVASAVEEMSASLSEVSSSTKDAAKIVEAASVGASASADTVHRLGESAKHIDRVVDLITGIAEQTNLLALNATIEAASAGAAGKGFAVVANEVKELAKQTREATEEIRTQVGTIQTNTQSAVVAINEIVTVVGRINEVFSTIASAVHEQTITIDEIARNVAEAARSGDEVSRNVQEAATGASEISRNVQQAITAVADIARSVTELAQGANEIARNAAEASQGMDSVSSSVMSVDKVAGETRESANGLTDSARTLSTMADELNKLVERFTV